MNSFVHTIKIILFSFLLTVIHSQGTSSNGDNLQRKKQDFYCSACKLMSETIFREMNNVDPNERIQVGSFRVDGQGHQKLKEVPVSETAYHLENVFEDLCSKFLRTGSEVIPPNLKNLYEHACDDILEEHHDHLIDLLLKQNKNIDSERQLAEIFCLTINQYCQADQLEELFKPKSEPIDEEKDEEEEEEKTEL